MYSKSLLYEGDCDCRISSYRLNVVYTIEIFVFILVRGILHSELEALQLDSSSLVSTTNCGLFLFGFL